MRVVITVFCIALVAGAHGGQWSSGRSRITFPDFLRYFPSYARQYFSSTRENYSREEEEEWGYEDDNGPNTWGRTFPTCTGRRQSPIALSGRSAELSNFRVDFSGYDQETTANLTNTGHTVVLSFAYGGSNPPPPRMKLQNGDISQDFIFDTLHFHWPSEHTIDSKEFELEMHMVHTRDPSDTSPGDSILVLGYVFIFPKASRVSCRPGMEAVASALPFVREVNNTARINPLSPADFMPYERRQSNSACNFFLYPGSLTTPPCTESVTWLVKKTPLVVTRSQLFRFENLVQTSDHHTLRENDRPTQPLYDRTVQYKACRGK